MSDEQGMIGPIGKPVAWMPLPEPPDAGGE